SPARRTARASGSTPTGRVRPTGRWIPGAPAAATSTSPPNQERTRCRPPTRRTPRPASSPSRTGTTRPTSSVSTRTSVPPATAGRAGRAPPHGLEPPPGAPPPGLTSRTGAWLDDAPAPAAYRRGGRTSGVGTGRGGVGGRGAGKPATGLGRVMAYQDPFRARVRRDGVLAAAPVSVGFVLVTLVVSTAWLDPAAGRRAAAACWAWQGSGLAPRAP